MARQFSPDPFAAAVRVDHPVTWMYGQAEFELSQLQRLVAEGFAANRYVHYVENHSSPSQSATFRVGSRPHPIRISWDENAHTSIDGAALRAGADGWYLAPAGLDALVITVHTTQGAAALAVETAFAAESEWQVLSEERWMPVQRRSGNLARAAHREDETVTSLALQATSLPGVFDAGATLLGRPVFSAEGVPTISSGESLEEALFTGVHETRHNVVQLPDGRWTSEHRLGFRYLKISECVPSNVIVEANIRGDVPAGVFICSDGELTRMAGIAAYTIRLCMQSLVLDGVKRDRMPWIGDQALNILANAYTVADAGIARDGLVALGRPRHGYVNGIADYSLWWIITQGFHQRYFGDRPHLLREADVIHRFVEKISEDCGADGIFRPRADGTFPDAVGGVLIDWGVIAEPGRDLTVLQVLWFWALQTAADLLAAAGHDGAERWRLHADLLRSTLQERAWDPQGGVWREYLDSSGFDSPYPNVIAILAGLGEPTEAMVHTIEASPVGTPFMTGFALKALARAGKTDVAIGRMRGNWQAMTDAGATTYWEDFAVHGENPYAMYGRQFGKSLSHAWSAAPAALLPELVLGLRPLSDGWARFSVDPDLGELAWAATVVTTPFGDIVVDANIDTVTVQIPEHTELRRPDGFLAGPATVTFVNPPTASLDRNVGSTALR